MPIDRQCCVPNCYNKSPYHHFHKFPTDAERRKIWLDNIGNEKLKTMTASQLLVRYVCHSHFEEKYHGQGCRTLLRKAVPTIFPLEPSLEVESFDDDNDDYYESFTRLVDRSKKVLVTTNDFPESGLQMLRDSYILLQSKFSGYEKRDMENNQKEVAELIEGVSAVVWATKHPLTVELLDIAGPELKIVSCASAAYDNIDVTELKARGIKLCNTPNVVNAAIADVTVGLVIATSRRFHENVMNVKKGIWKVGFQLDLGIDIKGSVVGIVGLGGIGQAIVKRLKGFEVKQFLFTGRSGKEEGKELGAEFVSWDHLLRESDFVILACPVTPETKHMINKVTLKKMKSQSVLINIGYGGCINHDDLYEALRNKEIYAAGLDVATPEPLPHDHPLNTLPNCYITPHIGTATIGTLNRMAEMTALNVIQAIRDGPLLSEVVL